MDAKATLLEKIGRKDIVVGIIGMGYVGLPLACEFNRVGIRVVGIDILPRKIEVLNSGVSDVDDIPSSLVKKYIDAGLMAVTSDYSRIAECDAVAICVPTPLNKTKDPDVSFILAATNSMVPYLHAGTLVVLESTSYPGTTDELVQPRLEEKGFKVGCDVFLAFSPERVDPGNPRFNTRNTPKVIGGVTPACNEVCVALYSQCIDTLIPVSSTRAAEMVKLLENTFRSVNIGLVNEVALMCHKLGVNVWEIIDAAASKPFGFLPFHPGPGLGGHCIPIDPHYLSWKLKSLNYYARFIELAGDINASMPAFVVSRVGDTLNEVRKPIKGSKILVLGVAYKRDISDLRESPALDVLELLLHKGAIVEFTDPHVEVIRAEGALPEMHSVPCTPERLAEADLVLIITDHAAFDYDQVAEHARLIFDTRNATKRLTRNREKIHRL